MDEPTPTYMAAVHVEVGVHINAFSFLFMGGGRISGGKKKSGWGGKTMGRGDNCKNLSVALLC